MPYMHCFQVRKRYALRVPTLKYARTMNYLAPISRVLTMNPL